MATRKKSRKAALRAPKHSIAQKLALLVMAAVGTAAVAMTAVFLWLEISHYAETKARSLTGTAQVFASATAKAVAARNAGAAQQAMRAIGQIPDLVYARVELPKGQLLAVMGGVTQLDGDLRINGGKPEKISPLALLSTKTLQVAVPIVESGAEVGRFVLVADTRDLYDQLLSSLRGVLIGSGAALLVGLFVATRLQRGLTQPLRELSQTITSIRRSHDYKTRVKAASNDEVGLLVDGFNAMLGEIAQRDSSLEAHRRNLEQEVQDRTQDLQIAKDAAEAASVAKSDFLATMSHEIRTPMNGVMVMAELLAAADIPQRQRRYAEVISKSGQSLLAIINDILDFSKIESGKLELERIALDPAELAEDVTSLFGERARSKGLDLSSYIAPETPQRIASDPVRINQVISNLVNNALKFTETGFVSLEVGPDPRGPARLRFAVTDTGIGIPAGKLHDIFGAFTQADQSTTRKFGGTGLGLAISKRLIEAMGGELTVESVCGEGSTFAFSIPAEAGAEAASWPHAGAGDAAPVAIVAVAGDATRAALQRYLTAAGYEVEIAPEGAAPRGAAAVIVADPERLGEIGPKRGKGEYVLCLAALGDSLAHHLVQDGRADTALSRPLVRSEFSAALARMAAGEPLRDAAPRAGKPDETIAALGAYVLVADDSAVNREVAVEALKRLGATAALVENGAEAAAAVERETFDAVLMDVSMPEVDGFEAARRIRAAEAKSGGRRVPIIAVTAHVLGSAADAWRDAGMDGVLHKPFTVKSLGECLAAIAPVSQPSATTMETPPAESIGEEGAETPILNAETLEQLRLLATSGPAGFVERVFGLYLEHGPKTAAEISGAFEAGDIAAAGRGAHALKSMSLNIGASRVAAAALELERLAHQEPAGVTRAHVDELAAHLRKALAEIEGQKAELCAVAPSSATG